MSSTQDFLLLQRWQANAARTEVVLEQLWPKFWLLARRSLNRFPMLRQELETGDVASMVATKIRSYKNRMHWLDGSHFWAFAWRIAFHLLLDEKKKLFGTKKREDFLY